MKVKNLFVKKHTARWWYNRIPDRKLKRIMYYDLPSEGNKTYTSLKSFYRNIYERTDKGIYYRYYSMEVNKEHHPVLKTIIAIFYKVENFFLNIFKYESKKSL